MTGANAINGLQVRVLDADGTPLTTAVSGVGAEAGAVILAEVESPGALMTFYFGRGERQVVLEFPDLTVEGMVETWWIGGQRVWQIFVDRPLATLGLDGSVRPEQAAERR
jgi:hypothetical protein